MFVLHYSAHIAAIYWQTKINRLYYVLPHWFTKFYYCLLLFATCFTLVSHFSHFFHVFSFASIFL